MSKPFKKLTDKQVAALTDCYHRGVTTNTAVVTAPDEDVVSAYDIRALALEVQQARKQARRENSPKTGRVKR